MEEMDLCVLKTDTVGFAGCFNGVRGKRKRGIKDDYVKKTEKKTSKNIPNFPKLMGKRERPLKFP